MILTDGHLLMTCIRVYSGKYLTRGDTKAQDVSHNPIQSRCLSWPQVSSLPSYLSCDTPKARFKLSSSSMKLASQTQRAPNISKDSKGAQGYAFLQPMRISSYFYMQSSSVPLSFHLSPWTGLWTSFLLFQKAYERALFS